ncbi:MAG TPA: hypothetical protein PK228_10280, partial [Saprospiraceae bacterium]|nr:hypothetical protein [Saprospiraceae bacterium]
MPTIFEKIETALAESTVDVQINAQVGELGSVRLSLKQFSENGRAEIESFIKDLGEVPPPKSLHAKDLEDSFNAFLAAFPDSVSGVSVETSAKTDELVKYVHDVYVAPLEAFFDLYRSIDELLLQFQGVGFAGNSGAGNSNTAPLSGTGMVFSPDLVAGLEELKNALDDIIAPVNGVDSLIILAAIVIAYIPREYFSTSQAGYLDEVLEMAQTLADWSTLSNSALAAKLLTNLQSVDTFLGECFTDLEPLVTAAENAGTALTTLYNSNKPDQDILDITAGLDKLAIGISSQPQDLTAVNDALATLNVKTVDLKTKLEAITTGFFEGDADDDLAKALEDLLDQLEDKIIDILNRLKPPIELEPIHLFPDTFSIKNIDLELDDAVEAVHRALSGLCALIQKLNLGPIAAGFQTATGNLNQKISEWEALVDDFYDQVKEKLETVEDQIDGIDTAAVLDDAKKKIKEYKELIQTEVTWILTKIQKTIDDYVKLVEQTAGQYSYEDLEESLNTFIQSVAEILMEYQDEMDKVKNTIETVTEKLKSYSFKSVSDLVVELIDEVTEELNGIDPEKTNDALLVGLTVALAVIPTEEELRKKMDKLEAQLDELIESGPIALLNKIKDKPAELLAKIKEKSPVPLIKEKLSEQYKTLIATLEKFEPSLLLNPLEEKLQEIDALIAPSDNPCKQFDVVVELYAKLLATLARFKPETILAVLEAEKA